jgi:hypothetical protein
MKSVAAKKTDVRQIKSDSAKRSVAVSRSVTVLMKTVAEKHLASLRGWLVRGPSRTSGARRKSCAHATTGRTDLRCYLTPRLTWRI